MFRLKALETMHFTARINSVSLKYIKILLILFNQMLRLLDLNLRLI
jgi:hypothetical protein